MRSVMFWSGKAGEVCLAGFLWGALRCVALGQARWCSLGWGVLLRRGRLG